MSKLRLFIIVAPNNRYNLSIAECGGTFVLPKGQITSPNYPLNFLQNTYCEWLLVTESSHTMSLKFKDMDLDDSVNCTQTSVKVIATVFISVYLLYSICIPFQIYSGTEKNNDKLLLNVCGKKETKTIGFTSPISSTDHQMLVVFESNMGYTSKGFAADFETVHHDTRARKSE